MVRSIAMIIPGIDRIGGAEQQMLLLARGFNRRGWRVNVVALSGNGGACSSGLAAEGIGFESLGMRKGLADPRGWIRFHHWLRRERPDVVHAHLPHAVWLARWSRLAAPMRVLVDTVHTTATGGLGRRLGYRWTGWLPDRVSAVSQAVAEAYIKAGMVSSKKIMVLPNGVDTGFWTPYSGYGDELRRKLGWEREFVFLAAGRLEAVKDYPTLLAALPPMARLVIAGSGPLEGRLRALAHELGMAQRMRFLGFEADLRGWMRAADAFVLSSLWEGLPMGILEAAACALPVVATDVPGTREAVRDGETGFLVEAGKASALREAMARMMGLSPKERSTMGERARGFVGDMYGLARILDRWEETYERLLAERDRVGRWGLR